MCDTCNEKQKEVLNADIQEIIDPYIEQYPEKKRQFNQIKMNLRSLQSAVITDTRLVDMNYANWQHFHTTLDELAKEALQEREEAAQAEANPEWQNQLAIDANGDVHLVPLEQLLENKQKKKAEQTKIAVDEPDEISLEDEKIASSLSKLLFGAKNPF